MGLPPVPHHRALVDVGADEKVEVRSVTRTEGAEIQKLVEAGDPEAAEVALLAFGTDTARDEAAAWYGATAYNVVELVLQEIKRLSEVRVEEAGKSLPAGVHGGGTTDG